jgi:DUF4097 and DUF4098 domain-containing protein YvlB
MRPIVAAFGVATAALLPGALAAQSLDTTVTVRSEARLDLNSVSGSVKIQSWSRSQIRVVAEADGARVDFDASEGGVSVRAVPRRGEGDVDFTITVPASTSLEVHAISADVESSGVCGEASLSSISGGVTLRCGSGNVHLESVSGDVQASDVRGNLEINSTSGDVDAEQVRGDVSARSVSGDVSLGGVDGQDIRAETVSGDIGFSGPIHQGGRYGFRSHSGDVTVRPDGDLGAIVSVSTFSGDVESDWPMTINPGGGPVGPREWEFTIGTGGARLTLESFSGTIYLRRGGAAPRRGND